jgi:hypothetical protein
MTRSVILLWAFSHSRAANNPNATPIVYSMLIRHLQKLVFIYFSFATDMCLLDFRPTHPASIDGLSSREVNGPDSFRPTSHRCHELERNPWDRGSNFFSVITAVILDRRNARIRIWTFDASFSSCEHTKRPVGLQKKAILRKSLLILISIFGWMLAACPVT